MRIFSSGTKFCNFFFFLEDFYCHPASLITFFHLLFHGQILQKFLPLPPAHPRGIRLRSHHTACDSWKQAAYQYNVILH